MNARSRRGRRNVEEQQEVELPRIRFCPICGKRAKTYQTGKGRYWFVGCTRDPSCCRVGAFNSETEAIEWWNQRWDDGRKDSF